MICFLSSNHTIQFQCNSGIFFLKQISLVDISYGNPGTKNEIINNRKLQSVEYIGSTQSQQYKYKYIFSSFAFHYARLLRRTKLMTMKDLKS